MRGLVFGKFCPYHNGHAHLIWSARAQVDELVVLVCSTPREPIPGALRFRWVRDSHPDCRVVHVAEDVPQAPDESAEFWPIWTALVERYAGRVDVVFTSDAYGDELARRLGARHVSIDEARAHLPVSATAIRIDPMTNWRFIPPVVRPYFAKRVALVGTESTGKTTLSERLAAHFDTAWVPEYGRPYCEIFPADTLTLPDFEAIAWGQATWEDDAAMRANRVLICDTELQTTATWSDLIANERPQWLTAAARARHYDLFLMLAPDVPWVADGTRVLSERRERHTDLLRRELVDSGRRVVDIAGPFEAREALAIRAIEALIAPAVRDR